MSLRALFARCSLPLLSTMTLVGLAACGETPAGDSPADDSSNCVADSAAEGDVDSGDVAQPPSAPVVHLGPSAPYTTDDLVAVIDVASVDPDGDAVAYTYAWKQDGSVRTDLGGASVPASETGTGQVWEVTVTPNDGAFIGASATATTTILNSPPTAPAVALSPMPVHGGEDLTCTLMSSSTDADDDVLTYRFAWDVDGVPYEGAGDLQTSSTVEGAAVAEGQVWTCAVTANDGAASGTAGTASVTVAAGPVPCALAEGAWMMEVAWEYAPCGGSPEQAVEVASCRADGGFDLTLAVLSDYGMGGFSCTSAGTDFVCEMSDAATYTTATMSGTSDVRSGTVVSGGAVQVSAWGGMCSGRGTFTGAHD